MLRSHGQCRLADVLASRSVVGCPLEELIDLIAGGDLENEWRRSSVSEKTRTFVSAADRGLAIGMLENGAPPEEVAERFGVRVETVRRWNRERDKVGPAYQGQEKLLELQADNAMLREENQRLRGAVRALIEGGK